MKLEKMDKVNQLIRKRFLSLSILLLFIFNILAVLKLNTTGVSAFESPAIYIDPASTVDYSLTPGSTYTISVKTDYTGKDVQSWQFTLLYNPSVLHGGLNRTDIFTGDGSNKKFNLTGRPVVPQSEKVYVSGIPKSKPADYTIDYLMANITFTTAPGVGAEVKVIYFYGGVTNGNLITTSKDPSAMFIPGTFDNTAGTLSLTAAIFFFITPPPPTATGPGTLANVTFTVVGTGVSDIILGDKTKLVGWNFTMGKEYLIIDAATMPGHIQHGTFLNTPPTHDVAVADLFVPAKAALRQLVPINVTVANVGTYYENVTLMVSYNSTPINTILVYMLPPMKSEVVKLGWDTSVGVVEGNYLIKATATIPEYDENPANNNKTKPITLKLFHDVAITNLVTCEEAVVGQVVPINVTVTNQGSYDETVTVSVYNENTVIDTQIFSLIIGKSTTRLFSWDTSTGVAGGDYTINATATITELDYEPGDNVQTKLIGFTFVRDVAVINITRTPEMPIVGQLVTINVTIENRGSYSEDFEVWFTCNVTITRAQVTVYTTKRESVTPPLGDSTTLSFNWNTTGITPGGHKIVAEAILPEDVDPDNNRAISKYLMWVISSLGSILGYVRDSFTGHPIVGANVTVDTVASATTGKGGKYSIANVPAGTYNVTASAHGYESSSETINVTAGETILNFNLTSIVGTITGTVTDSLTGEPIPTANVTANGYSATTDTDGNYNIANMPPGNYTVTASADGYKSSTKTNITVVAGQTTTLNFTLTPLPTTGTISGVVKDSSTGDPIADAIVTANDMSATTNSSGAYVISDVPLGNYTVTASADGYKNSTITNIAVVAGETTQVDFELTPVQPLNILIYVGAAAIAIIVVVATAIYIFKVRKPKPK